MARYLNDQSIIQDNILLHIQNLYNEHSKKLQGTPIYVTYYHKNMSFSDQDRTLENVKEVIGTNSPIKYDKIENFPLYLVEALSITYDVDETYGLNTDSEGEGVILPKMIKPYVDDFFHIIYNEESYIFKITKVEFDRINGLKYYKISYMLSQYKQNEIEEQIEEEFVTRYENVGTEDNAVVSKKSSLVIDVLYEIIEKITNIYMRTYMNPKFNVLTYKYNDKNLYNEFLIRFIIDNNIFDTKFKKLYKSYYIQDIFPDSTGMFELYDDTIYMALSEDDIKYFKKENMVTMEIQKNLKDNPFSFDYEDYYRTYYVDTDSHKEMIASLDQTYEAYKNNLPIGLNYDYNYSDVFGKNSSNMYQYLKAEEDPQGKVRHILICPHNNEFIERVNNGELFTNNSEYFLENIIIQFLNKKLNIDEEFVSTLKRKNWHPAFKEFLLIPCLIFILKKEIDSLTNQ